MTKIVHSELTQGSDSWRRHRATMNNAGDAAAMLGCSAYCDRNELLEVMALGDLKEVTEFQQRIFDSGHRYEALARPIQQEIVGEDLLPLVVSLEHPDLRRRLGASCDGLTYAHDIGAEHKRLNEALRDAMPNAGRDSWRYNDAADLPKMYRAQMEQQVMVTGAGRVLFSATDWDAEGNLLDERHCWYSSDPQLRAEILAGWRQFEADLAAFKPREKRGKAVAEALETLPAVTVRTAGHLTVTSNLDDLGPMLAEFIKRLPAKPSTDTEFATAAKAVTALETLEKQLEAEEKRSLATITDVAQLQQQVATLRATSKQARLALNKLVEGRKETIKKEAVQRGIDAVNAHVKVRVDQLGGRAGLPFPQANFAECVKRLSSWDSLQSKVDDEIARSKILVDDDFARATANLAHFDATHPDRGHLFPDLAVLCLKAKEDFVAICANRVRQADEAEERRRQAEEERLRLAAQRQNEAAATQPPAVAASAPTAASDRPFPNVRTRPTFLEGVHAGPPTLKLGTICERLGFNVTAAFLEGLGVSGTRERQSVLFHEADWPVICRQLVAHIQNAVHIREAA